MRTILRKATTVLTTSAGLYRELAVSALQLLPRRGGLRASPELADRTLRGCPPRLA